MLRPRVLDDPRSCQMDGCAILNQYRRLTEIVVGDAAVRDHGSDGTWAMAGCCDNVAIRMITRATCHHEMRATCSRRRVPTSIIISIVQNI
ncbi:hypothetical protein AAG906_003939 [Vitis piasezkii]